MAPEPTAVLFALGQEISPPWSCCCLHSSRSAPALGQVLSHHGVAQAGGFCPVTLPSVRQTRAVEDLVLCSPITAFSPSPPPFLFWRTEEREIHRSEKLERESTKCFLPSNLSCSWIALSHPCSSTWGARPETITASQC